MDKHEYEVVVYEYGAKRYYFAKDKKEALALYTKYSKERPFGDVKIFKIKNRG
jgi:hypothetical protein